MFKKAGLCFSVLLILTALLSACSSNESTQNPSAPSPPVSTSVSSEPVAAPDSQTIVIGMSAAFQGSSAGLGIELYRGTRAYLDYINEQGGVNGRKIVIKAYNDSYDPVATLENTNRLINQDKVFLLYGYVGTPTVTRVLPLIKKYTDQNYYLFFPFTGAQPQREYPYNQYAFNLRASYREEIKGLVDNLHNIGRTRIAIFYQADSYGRSGWDGVRRALAQYGEMPVAEASYARGTDYKASFQTQVDILKRGNPDAVISIGTYSAAAGFIRDSRLSGLDVPIANVSFASAENMVNLLRESERETGKILAANLVTSQVVPSYEDKSLPAVVDYRAIMGKFNPAPPPAISSPDYKSLEYSFASFEGFLNARLLVEILQRLGPELNKEDLRSSVENVQIFDLGIKVPVTFGAGKNQGIEKVFYTTFKDGIFAPVTDWKEWAK